MNKLSLILIAVLLYSCDFKSKKAESENNSIPQSVETNSSAKVESEAKREMQTKSGKSFAVVELHPVGLSLSDIAIVPTGFQQQDSIKIKDADPIITENGVELADLDNNGFEEVYIFTRAVGSGSYGEVYAFASEKDKVLKPIDCSAISETKTSEFKGYQGHDSFKIEGNAIVRTFPIYKDGDGNASPSGGKKSVPYKLKDMRLVRKETGI